MVNPLKRAAGRSDPVGMAHPAELPCPICNADLPLAGDERLGDDVYCTYCGAPSVLVGRDKDDPDTWDLEEDL